MTAEWGVSAGRCVAMLAWAGTRSPHSTAPQLHRPPHNCTVSCHSLERFAHCTSFAVHSDRGMKGVLMGLKVVERYFKLCKHLSFQSIIGEISTSVKRKEIRKGGGQFWISHLIFSKTNAMQRPIN